MRRLSSHLLVLFTAGIANSLAAAPGAGSAFPRPLDQYAAAADAGLWAQLVSRAQADPMNLVATAVFVLAIVHTFFTPKILHLAHKVEHAHAERQKTVSGEHGKHEVSFLGQLLHFLGEVEAVFGLWVVVLMVAITVLKGWGTTVDYLAHQVNFTEALFVVIIMALASTRPILVTAEACLRRLASIGKGTVGAWWLVLLIVAPLLGSFITEPAAMTIAALLLVRMFYHLKPSPRLAYATLGLLFVNISVGGTLTHFAAPPVLMVAAPWKWDTAYMFTHFGWKAALGILVATVTVWALFRKEFAALESKRLAGAQTKESAARIPAWITLVQFGFMAWTVFVAHYPALFIGGFLFFLAFAQATAHHQQRVELRSPLLVGFFLAGLVVHGGLQGWWIEPVLKSLGELPLFMGALGLTAFNDNAAITYLATLVPGFSENLKYAVVAGAVAGGGLTVIANAPNPAGQSILQKYFPGGISPLGLLSGALFPTLVVSLCLLFL